MKTADLLNEWLARDINSLNDEDKALREHLKGFQTERHAMALKYMLIHKWLPHYGVKEEHIQTLRDDPDEKNWMILHYYIVPFWNNRSKMASSIKFIFDLNITFHNDSPTSSEIKMQEHLKTKFINSEFDPRASEFVYECLNDLAKKWKPNDYYYPGTALIQSSGFGKSHAVKSLAITKNVYVVYCSFMEGKGFPKKSGISSKIINGDSHKFASYYFACLQQISTLKMTPTEIVNLCIMEENNSFWDGVNQKMETIQSEISDEESLIAESADDIDDFNQVEDQDEEMQITSQEANEFKNMIINVMQGILPGNENNLRVVFVFDEVRTLLGSDENKQDSPFACMRRAARMFPSNMGLAVVILDTISSVSNLTPTSERDPSLRPQLSGPGSEMFPPINLLPTMDVNQIPINVNRDLLEYHLKPRILYRRGRPLWSVALPDETRDFLLTDSINYAMRKLIGGKGISKNKSLDDYECLAILRARLPFNVWRSDVASELIRNHMSLCTYISSDRHFVHSSMVSEPLLADAATTWMCSKGYWVDILYKYMLMTGNGVVDIGKCGEHVAAIIFLLARDVVLIEMSTVKPDLNTRMIRVEDFLKALLNPESFRHVKEYLTVDTQSPITQGVISFSHFSHVNKTPTRKELLLLMARGCAVLCKEMQKGIDLIIPVLMPNVNGVFVLAEENLTYILVQVKNYAKSVSDSKNMTIAKNMSAKKVGLNPPKYHYLTINMNVGEEEYHCKIIDTKQVKQKAIVLGGIDHAVFPCLSFKDFSKIKLHDVDVEKLSNSIPTPDEDDVELDVDDDTEMTIQCHPILKDSKEDEGQPMSFILKHLLGRRPQPTIFYEKDSKPYEIVRQMCVPFYLEELVNSNEKQLSPKRKERKESDSNVSESRKNRTSKN